MHAALLTAFDQETPSYITGGNASLGASLLAALASGSSPAAALACAVGATAFAAGASLVSNNGLTLGALGELAAAVGAGRPLVLLTDVDAGSLVGGPMAGLGGTGAGLAGNGIGSAGQGGIFDEGEGVLAEYGALHSNALQNVGDWMEDHLL